MPDLPHDEVDYGDDEKASMTITLKLPDFDSKKVTWWGTKRDDEMTRDQLIEQLRYLKWVEQIRHELANVEHNVFMNQIGK